MSIAKLRCSNFHAKPGQSTVFIPKTPKIWSKPHQPSASISHFCETFLHLCEILPRKTDKALTVETFGVHELPDAIKPGIAAGAWRRFALEAMLACRESVQIALYAHAPQSLPALH